jgi:hypothetical protein
MLIGEPPARPGTLELWKSEREREGPQSELSKGFLSCGGDSVKHSSRETDEALLVKPFPPAPNVKVGSWMSVGFETNAMLFVDWHFVRESPGRRKDDRLRLVRC